MALELCCSDPAYSAAHLCRHDMTRMWVRQPYGILDLNDGHGLFYRDSDRTVTGETMKAGTKARREDEEDEVREYQKAFSF